MRLASCVFKTPAIREEKREKECVCVYSEKESAIRCKCVCVSFWYVLREGYRAVVLNRVPRHNSIP
jgi:hypothetical protein